MGDRRWVRILSAHGEAGRALQGVGFTNTDVAVELSASNWKQLWIPPGFAHGYLTLEANAEVIYKVTDYWAPQCERGLAWNDPEVGIDWGIPEGQLTLAEKDRSNPRLSELELVFRFEN